MKDFILGAPLGAKTFTKDLEKWNRMTRKEKMEREVDERKDELNWDAPETAEEKDEGGVFLILLFYYFQDATIVHINTIYVNGDTALLNSLKQVIGGIFKFRLDVLHFANAVCAVPGLTPAVKVVFKLFFVPLVLGILLFVYGLALFLEKRNKKRKFWDFLARRAALAIMFAILFSYQKLASSLFKLVHCVNINDSPALFIDGEIDCYTHGQIIVFMILIFSICPFSFYIAVSPALMKNGYISLAEFYLGCLLPVPMVIYWAIKYGIVNSSKVKPSDDAVSVYKLLQGSYREFDLPGILRYTCWSGVLLIRRLFLILAATFINDVIIRLSVMMAVCQVALLHHVLVRPCKERRSNVAGTVSSSALLTVCTVNFLRAAYESAEYVPEGPNFTLMQVLDQVENSLLIWIPVIGVLIILLVLIIRLFRRFIYYVMHSKTAPVSPSGSVAIQPKKDEDVTENPENRSTVITTVEDMKNNTCA